MTNNNEDSRDDMDTSSELRLLEMKTVAMLARALFQANMDISDWERFNGKSVNLKDSALALLEIAESEYEDDANQDNELVKEAMASLETKIKKGADQYQKLYENLFVVDSGERVFLFINEITRNIIDSTEVVTDTFQEDVAKKNGFSHNINMKINFDNRAWGFDFIDLNEDDSIDEGFANHGSVQMRSTLNGDPIDNEDDKSLSHTLSLFALGVKNTALAQQGVNSIKDDAAIVAKAEKMQRIFGGDFTDYLIFAERLSGGIAKANSMKIGYEDTKSSILSYIETNLNVCESHAKAVSDIFLLDINLETTTYQ